MATRVPARLTRAEGRRFGVTVGLAFVALAGVAWWRAHPSAAIGLGALGGALILAGLAIPSHLGPVERAWMKLAHIISKVTTPIVMGVMYFLVLTVVGLVRRTVGRNPMEQVETNRSFWQQRPEGSRRSASMLRQF